MKKEDKEQKTDKKQKAAARLPIQFHKMQVICIAAGIFLYLAVKLGGGEGILQDGRIRRPAHGEGESSYEILVEGLEKEEIPVLFSIEERRYSDQEAEEIFKTVWKEALQAALGENPSLQEVRGNLRLSGWSDSYGIRIRWFSENQDIIDSYGNVLNEDNPEVKEEGETVWLKALMTDGEHEKEFEVPVTVFPPVWEERERQRKELEKEIAKKDEEQSGTDWLELPAELNGQPVSYKEKKGDGAGFFPAMGFFLAILYGFKGKQEERNRQKRRSRQMLLDYSEIVSRLMVFMGAGMTVRSAWGKITEDYEKRVEAGEGKRRYAYEEMSRTYYQITAGKAEGEAYEEFGRRCGLQPYMKLSGLLIQNRKEGMKNLNQMMKLEMASAFEERKNLARRQGEEAGTKLLMPLFFMLGVVMVMIMVPAMLAFSA